MDENLNWHSQIDSLASKLSSNLYFVRKISKLGNKKLSLNCYYAFIYSHITYSILLWGSSSIENMNKISLTVSKLRPFKIFDTIFHKNR